jgi:ubiquitin-like protein Pup
MISIGVRVGTSPEDETMATFIKDLKRARSGDYADRQVDGQADPIPLYMAAGEQKQKSKGGGGDDGDGEKGEGGQKLAEKGEELKEEMDDLLDEIDSVLEENAEEFVKNYVQRGGE